MAFSSYLIADFVIDEANRQFAPLFRINEERLDIFRQYCAALDTFIEEFGGSTLEVNVDEEDMTVHMKMELEELVVDDRDRAVFTQLVERALSMRVEHGDGDTVCIQLVFPSLWERAV